MFKPNTLVLNFAHRYILQYSKTCLKRPLKTLKQCGRLTQVNYGENFTFGGLKGRSLHTGGLETEVILRTGSAVFVNNFEFSTYLDLYEPVDEDTAHVWIDFCVYSEERGRHHVLLLLVLE